LLLIVLVALCLLLRAVKRGWDMGSGDVHVKAVDVTQAEQVGEVAAMLQYCFVHDKHTDG
jgi:hypothetical protein